MVYNIIRFNNKQTKVVITKYIGMSACIYYMEKQNINVKQLCI